MVPRTREVLPIAAPLRYRPSHDPGPKVRRLRTDRDLRRGRFAALAGISTWTVTELEHDRLKPLARRLWGISRAPGVPVDFLLDEGAPRPAPPARSEPSGDPENGRPPSRPGTQDTVRLHVTREEEAYLEARPEQPRSVWLLCRSVSTATPEALLLAWRLVKCNRPANHILPSGAAAARISAHGGDPWISGNRQRRSYGGVGGGRATPSGESSSASRTRAA